MLQLLSISRTSRKITFVVWILGGFKNPCLNSFRRFFKEIFFLLGTSTIFWHSTFTMIGWFLMDDTVTWATENGCWMRLFPNDWHCSNMKLIHGALCWQTELIEAKETISFLEQEVIAHKEEIESLRSVLKETPDSSATPVVRTRAFEKLAYPLLEQLSQLQYLHMYFRVEGAKISLSKMILICSIRYSTHRITSIAPEFSMLDDSSLRDHWQWALRVRLSSMETNYRQGHSLCRDLWNMWVMCRLSRRRTTFDHLWVFPTQSLLVPLGPLALRSSLIRFVLSDTQFLIHWMSVFMSRLSSSLPRTLCIITKAKYVLYLRISTMRHFD